MRLSPALALAAALLQAVTPAWSQTLAGDGGRGVTRVDLSTQSARTQTIAIPKGRSAMVELPVDARDVLVNVNALGQPVPSARFMGGREYELIRAGSTAMPDRAGRDRALAAGLMILPAIEPGSGPFRGRAMEWLGAPAPEGQRTAALSWYLALMTGTCLDLVGARGPAIVEGPFARNPDYLDMLAVLRPEGVEVAASSTGTSVGAALLCLGAAPAPRTTARLVPDHAGALRDYAALWRRRVIPTRLFTLRHN